ncbi:hypothetical protein Scep_018381 [Stephania cephalantha]|uniref:Uncharacterized protein n=1 Tax=Stephania cephalantha TaxID=152367 RepID=A0AAP0ISR1_9MAGN
MLVGTIYPLEVSHRVKRAPPNMTHTPKPSSCCDAHKGSLPCNPKKIPTSLKQLKPHSFLQTSLATMQQLLHFLPSKRTQPPDSP